MPDSIFQWQTLREVARDRLPYFHPIDGWTMEIELLGGTIIQAFRADDREFYFCHGLTFGGIAAPGGPISPYSGRNVRLILESCYRAVEPHSDAAAGDILVWSGIGDQTPHSAILLAPKADSKSTLLEYHSQVQSKNGKLPAATMSLLDLIEGPHGYGESYAMFRRTQ